MLCQHVSKLTYFLTAVLAVFFTSTANAYIEHTKVVMYDLSSQQYIAHVVQLETKDDRHISGKVSNPAIPNVTISLTWSRCIQRQYGEAMEGLLKFESLPENHLDQKISSLISFVREHNVRVWWFNTPLQHHLSFSADSGGLLVTNPPLRLNKETLCDENESA